MWDIELHPEVEKWFLDLCWSDPATADQVVRAIDVLTATGPRLGRPLVDRLKGSAYHNMKELRPGSTGRTMLAQVRGYQLMEIRQEIGMTQAQLAQAAGLSQARISQIEKGEIVSLETLRSYVTGLGGEMDIVARIGDIELNIA
jgi:hypothetical protein